LSDKEMTMPPEPPTRAQNRRAHDKRPAAPKTQRSGLSRAAGVAGELLITTGTLVLLFLVWQFTLNGWMLTNQQTNDASALSHDWATSSPTTTPDPKASPSPDSDTVLPAGDIPSTAAPAQTEDFAILYVPRFGADFKKTIAEGVDERTVLNNGGAGHYPGTQMPGQVGNFAIAGHRDGWGSPFININELQPGDPIYIETQDGWYTYTFRDLEYVTPEGVGVIDPVPQNGGATPTDRLITLTSCNPLYIASERMAAYGVLDSFQPRSDGPPAAIAGLAA
jgi:sortase A